MHPQIEVMSGAHSWRISLEADRTTFGKAAENDVALEHDPTASHLHVGNLWGVQGRCVPVLGNQGPGPFVGPLSTGARAIYQRTKGQCPFSPAAAPTRERSG